MAEETGPYHLRHCLGVGGQGQVWHAAGPEGTAALKLALRPQERQQLRIEGETLARLRHPSIVRYLRHDPSGGWLATALVRGQPINHWASGRSLAARVAALAGVARGLAYLHAQGIRHGDIKPSNVLIDDTDTPVLIDLSPHLSGASLGYAAPEQLREEPLGPAADVYALGCLAFYLLTDQEPFSAADRSARLWLPVNALPLPPSSLVSGIPQQVEEAVMACLARTPGQRPADLEALALTLEEGLEGELARPVLGMRRERRQLRQRLVEAVEGSSPIMAVIGPPRSGRETLIEELLQAATREGMRALRPPPQADAAAVLSQLPGRPFALRLEAGAAHTAPLCAAIQSSQPAGITLVRAEAPLPGLPPEDSIHPSTLRASDIAAMLEHANQAPTLAPDVLRITRGHPGVVRDYIRDRGLPSDLSPQQHQLLSALAAGSSVLSVLALQLGIGEHDLLDIAEPLIDRGLLEERDGGRSLTAGPLLPRRR